MELILERIEKTEKFTLGRLSVVKRVDDEYMAGEEKKYFCDTIEPKYVKMGYGTKRWKHKRAIPSGRYPVVITYDKRRDKWLPQLLKVRCYKTVRIYVGKKVTSFRHGMIIGQHYQNGRIVNSPTTVFNLKELIVEAKRQGEGVFLTVKR